MQNPSAQSVNFTGLADSCKSEPEMTAFLLTLLSLFCLIHSNSPSKVLKMLQSLELPPILIQFCSNSFLWIKIKHIQLWKLTHAHQLLCKNSNWTRLKSSSSCSWQKIKTAIEEPLSSPTLFSTFVPYSSKVTFLKLTPPWIPTYFCIIIFYYYKFYKWKNSSKNHFW